MLYISLFIKILWFSFIPTRHIYFHSTISTPLTQPIPPPPPTTTYHHLPSPTTTTYFHLHLPSTCTLSPYPAQVIDDEVALKPHLSKLGQHFASLNELQRAEYFYLKAGMHNEAITMYNTAGMCDI